MLWIWLTVIIVACIAEWLTQLQVVSIWAAFGGLAALICYLYGTELWVQVVVFFAVTIFLLAMTRPFVKKMTKFKKTPTNSDMYIGKSGSVIGILDASEGRLQVKVDNCVWSAITRDKTVLPVGTEIVVQDIEGVKLIVTPLKNTVKA